MSKLKKSAPKKANKEAAKKGTPSKKSSSKTSTATKTATSTKTSTDAYTQGNITVTGGAGKGSTKVNIAIPGLASKKNKAQKASTKSKGRK